MNDIPQRIRGFLSKNGMTKRRFAELCRISPSYVSLITGSDYNGKKISNETLALIEMVLAGQTTNHSHLANQDIEGCNVIPLLKQIASSGVEEMTFSQFRSLCEAEKHCKQNGLDLSELLSQISQRP